MQKNAWLFRGRRFAVTGIASTGVHVLIAFSFIHFAEWRPAAANALASLAATLFSYVVHTLWSFSQVLTMRSLWRFVVVSLATSGLAATIAGAAEILGLSYWVGIACVVCVVPLLSFIGHALWTYKR